MRVGTKSILFGVHNILVHPLSVAIAWWKLYGFPGDPRLWCAFILHDLGYWGLSAMESVGSETHVELGARIMTWLFGAPWGEFCASHSRCFARSRGVPVSQLCIADKLAFVLTPPWLYLPLARATGELQEYIAKSRERPVGSAAFTEEERKQIESEDPRLWLEGLQNYTRRWIEQHGNGGVGTWTGIAAQRNALPFWRAR